MSFIIAFVCFWLGCQATSPVGDAFDSQSEVTDAADELSDDRSDAADADDELDLLDDVPADAAADLPYDDVPDAFIDAGPELPEPGFCAPNDAPLPVRPSIDEPATLPFLHVDGTAVVDADGNPVALRGSNLGSWLAMETWVTGIGETTEEELLAALDAKAAELGLGDFLESAKSINLLDWLFETKSHRQLVDEWRVWCFANAQAANAEAVTALWAWFDDQPWVVEEESLWRYLAHRFGLEKAEALRVAFQEHYITELDVERAAALGLNLLRVPVWYQSLETEYAAGNQYREAGWQRLHQLGVWARKHNVYLMIDLHGVPGGQSTSAHQGSAAGGQLWDHPECITKTARIWTALAGYFAGDPHVAIYDLLNEPMNCPDKAAYQTVHQAMYEAVRAVDADHIVALEDGFLSPSKLASPLEMGWQNAMFSFHFYPWGADSADSYFTGTEKEIQRIADMFDRYQCPVLAGEFAAASGKESGPWAVEASDRVLGLLNQRGIHWTLWTWKFFADWALWGLYHPVVDPWKRVPLKDSSYDEIMAALVGMDSSGFEAADDYAQVVQTHAAAAVVPLSF
jgi:hypothetical protein